MSFGTCHFPDLRGKQQIFLLITYFFRSEEVLIAKFIFRSSITSLLNFSFRGIQIIRNTFGSFPQPSGLPPTRDNSFYFPVSKEIYDLNCELKKASFKEPNIVEKDFSSKFSTSPDFIFSLMLYEFKVFQKYTLGSLKYTSANFFQIYFSLLLSDAVKND